MQLITFPLRPARSLERRHAPLCLAPPRRTHVFPGTKLPFGAIPANVKVPDAAPGVVALYTAVGEITDLRVDGHLDTHPGSSLTEDLSDVPRKRAEAFSFGGDDAGDADIERRSWRD